MSDAFQTLDQMIHGIYDSITFAKGTRPDWDRARSFFTPDAPMIRITPEAVVRMTIDSWIRGFEPMIDDGTFPSFYQGEIARQTERFGDIAHVFSTYETKYHAEDSALIGRGINSIQLYWREGRWWISSMLWDQEAKDKLIPGAYLKTE